jgi:hypothetical protein
MQNDGGLGVKPLFFRERSRVSLRNDGGLGVKPPLTIKQGGRIL